MRAPGRVVVRAQPWRASKTMRAVPKCSAKLSEYLEDLRKKEDLELLREPIKEHGLFPEDADVDKTPYVRRAAPPELGDAL